MGEAANTVGIRKARMVRSRRYPGQLNLTPSRRTVDGNHKWYTYFLFGYLDLCWAMRVIGYTLQAARWGYVLSYGQVRLSLRCWLLYTH